MFSTTQLLVNIAAVENRRHLKHSLILTHEVVIAASVTSADVHYINMLTKRNKQL